MYEKYFFAFPLSRRARCKGARLCKIRRLRADIVENTKKHRGADASRSLKWQACVLT